MENTLIKLESLVKKYNSRKVVDEIDFEIYEQEVLGIIGPNGAGKTTTIEMILGIRLPDSGEIYYWDDKPKDNIGAQLQSVPFFPNMSVLNNLKLFATFYGKTFTNNELIDLLKKFKLSDVIYSKADRLSGGQQKKLAIAMSIMHNPKVIFLDEPTAALDPRARQEIRELISDLANKNISVVFSSHDMEEVAKLSDRIVLINNGTIKDIGSPKELLEKYDVSNLEKLYLKLT